MYIYGATSQGKQNVHWLAEQNLLRSAICNHEKYYFNFGVIICKRTSFS